MGLHGRVRADAGRRSVVIAPTAMVATSQPLATQLGVDILKRGGSAVDAAIAVNAALGLVEPMKWQRFWVRTSIWAKK